jgi:hypothetical protein
MTANIGSMDNVPTPGDPIRSNWPQEISQLARSVFATKAALDAATAGWIGLTDGAFAWTVAEQQAWNRIGGTWVAAGVGRLLKRVTSAAAVACPTGGATVATTALTLPAARILRIHGSANFSAGAGIGAFLTAGYTPSPGTIANRLAQVNNIGAIGGAVLTGEVVFLAGAGASTAILAAAGIGGTANTNGPTDPQVLEIYDLGPGPIP